MTVASPVILAPLFLDTANNTSHSTDSAGGGVFVCLFACFLLLQLGRSEVCL